MKPNLYFIYILALVFGLASCNEVVETQSELGNKRDIILNVCMPRDDNQTRISLTEVKGAKDLIARWEENDVVQLFVRQDGQNYSAGKSKVTGISSDGKDAMIKVSLPLSVSNVKPYTIYGFIGIEGNLSTEGVANCLAEIQRYTMNQFHAPMYFQVEAKDGKLPSASLKHFGTYELLHVKNDSPAEITYQHDGFNSELPWYQGKTTFRFSEEYDFTKHDSEWEGDARSLPLSIPADATGTFISWYIPSGYKMSNAALRAKIGNNTVISSNLKSSNVSITCGKAYHLYATWDGDKLLFGKGEIDENKLTLSTNSITMKVGGSEIVNISGGSGMYNVQNANPDIAEGAFNGNAYLTITAKKEGNAVITVHDQQTMEQESLSVEVKDMEDNNPHITIITLKNVGDPIKLEVKGKSNDLWIDLNNNNVRDNGEDLDRDVDTGMFIYEGPLYSNALSIYGDITVFKCNSNNITDIDVSTCANLRTLDIWGNALLSLDVSNNKQLVNLDCSSCGIQNLILPSSSSLRLLDCQRNLLESLDLSELPDLETLLCQFCYLSTINTTMNTKLKHLCCDANYSLTKLDLTNNQSLVVLGANYCSLSAEMLNSIYRQLPDISSITEDSSLPWPQMIKMLRVNNNPGSDSEEEERSIAEQKGWEFEDKWAKYYDDWWDANTMTIYYSRRKNNNRCDDVKNDTHYFGGGMVLTK